MNIESAKYIKSILSDTKDSVAAVIDGETISVPLDPANRHYAAILEWAEEDGNTIQEAD
tara:strand:+ start:403 stop:579 length:177 start_codon:yes stop_codon:yes gene_type:complete